MILRKAYPTDEPARPLGEGISLFQGSPKRLAMIVVQAMGHFVGNDIVDDPIGPRLDFIANADMTIGVTAVGATAVASGHVAHPADRLPLDAAVEIFLVDVLGTLMELGIGATLGQLLAFLQVLGDLIEQAANHPVGQPVRYSQQDGAILLPHPAGTLFEAFVPADEDGDFFAGGVFEGVLFISHRKMIMERG